ncbi:(SSU ribosomal protein S18P)-alanine acetyltransferase [Ignisphaera aggregans DSM 17230]|uniref:N-alpha-acetyltransferase n=1 Tax=Ignisphaera aggregans (strain DSM 17230 / JCM 13409 / AQ1.S1) TaxID=583356 RepID=E0SRM3_IGNAA|nr:(SSU ribosomal protein S18P)-alanine acetyltransferase [Ignisphaera aggregans DSM 17230]
MDVVTERIRIRPASMDDLDSVIAINIECLPEHYLKSFWIEHIEKWNDLFYVAEVNNEIVGYALARVENGSPITKNMFSKVGHVVSIAVREKYRRKGIATMLMSALIYTLKTIYGAEEVYLEVRVSNEPAIRLYQKLGFVIAKRIEQYYLDGEDAYLMIKKL